MKQITGLIMLIFVGVLIFVPVFLIDGQRKVEIGVSGTIFGVAILSLWVYVALNLLYSERQKQ